MFSPFNLFSKKLLKIPHKISKLCYFGSAIVQEDRKKVFPFHNCGLDDKDVNLIYKHFEIIEEFITESEEENFLNEIEPIFKRRRYEFDHWDGAIQGYKETEKQTWNTENFKVLQRMHDIAFPKDNTLLEHVHVLDLSKDGHIKPHIDSIKFCGNTIAGISLLSSAIMRLGTEKNNAYIDVLVKRRSLYIMRGPARYEFTHEVLENSKSFFNGTFIPRERRVSIICRNEPEGCQQPENIK